MLIGPAATGALLEIGVLDIEGDDPVVIHAQRGIDPRFLDVAWRCQQRLDERHRILRLTRNKPAGVVNIACARELACFLWEAATLT